ncbi:TPA: sodium:proton antiporter [Candidatus Scatousia excrementigallinarum]|uniref:Sodium:proton antiporter n=1 Tax=Candidatus Scatousia excrementigallinarum TaxID=2840935 RepID=A0A9D1F0G7_9BACT|nr:sodium:proton antiporter [Candidatus Scatousia excrementigallinarum]
MSIIFNPVVISVILLCILCVCRINVLLAIIISAIAAGVAGGLPIDKVMDTFISGMGGNSETALSYILLGTFAAAMTHTGLATILAKKIGSVIKDKKFILLAILTGIAMLSQNLIPVHIAFIPILIPPLLNVMNKLKLDRRAAACSLAFGLKAPYIMIPAGFGLIFQGLIAENMTLNGMAVLKNDVWKSTWILGLGMFIGLLAAVLISYRNSREYNDIQPVENELEREDAQALKLNKNHYITLLGAFATLIIQLLTKSLPLGALVGLGIVFGGGAVSHRKMDKLINEGIGLMGYVAFVMLVAAGFAMVLKATGGIDTLVQAILPFMQNSRFLAVSLMLLLGLFITMGIGTSFGTIPILAVLFIPVCIHLGFSPAATIVILAAAAALGDAGSPASDTTLGPTAGLNADGQHNHITDTCIPTFLHFNIPLIIFAIIAAYLF